MGTRWPRCSSNRSRRQAGGAGVELSRPIASELLPELVPELVPELLHQVELLAGGHQAAEPLRSIAAELQHLVDRCAWPRCCRPSSCWPVVTRWPSCSSSRCRRQAGGAGVELLRSIAAELLPELPPELVPELLHQVELLAGGHKAAEPLRSIAAELQRLVDRCAWPRCFRPSSCWPVVSRWPSCSSSRCRRLVGGGGVELSRSIAAELLPELPPELVPELLHQVELMAGGHQVAPSCCAGCESVRPDRVFQPLPLQRLRQPLD